MTDTHSTAAANDLSQPPPRDAAIHGLTMIFGDTVKHLAKNAEAQQTAILAMTAMIALLPGAGQIDPARLAVAVQTLTRGRKDGDEARKNIAAYVSMVVSMANKLPEMMAELETANAAAAQKTN